MPNSTPTGTNTPRRVFHPSADPHAGGKSRSGANRGLNGDVWVNRHAESNNGDPRSRETVAAVECRPRTVRACHSRQRLAVDDRSRADTRRGVVAAACGLVDTCIQQQCPVACH